MNIDVPQTWQENIEYRKEIRKWAAKKETNRKWLLDKCAKDWFFWCESFVWLTEPRPERGRPNVIPFIPWEHQRPMMQDILENLGYCDIGLEKARGEGASWSCLMIILHRWLFRDMHTYGLVSRNELAADNPDDPDSLGWKIDWQLQMLPQWMGGVKGKEFSRNVSKHTWINNRNGSSITAYPATGDLASGGRKTAFFMDELSKFPRGPDEDAMSSTEPVTNSRLLVSTPAGAEGAYYQAMTEPSSMIKLVLDWTKNPTRNRDLFRINRESQDLERLDGVTRTSAGHEWIGYKREFFKEYLPVLIKRGFDITDKSKLWSPWYVERCLRPRMTPKKIAQEYDRDYGGSGSRFFPGALISQCKEFATKPIFEGDILIKPDSLIIEKMTRVTDGALKLWFDIPKGQSKKKKKLPRPPYGDYVAGVDIASGQGGSMSSNSVISIVERRTGKKVAEYATPNLSPERLADVAIALCRWFVNSQGGPAYLIWEGNGYGGSFRDRVLDTDFTNFHYRTPHKSSRKKATKEPGWWSNLDSKRDLLGRYRHALTEGVFSNPNELALNECLSYQNAQGGKVEFIASSSDDEDPSNSGVNHGDRVIADALANFGMEELNGGTNTDGSSKEATYDSLNPPSNTFRYRQMMRQREAAKKSSW